MTSRLVWVLAGLLALPGLVVASTPQQASLEIERVNGTWKDLEGGLRSIDQGAITIDIRVPEHELIVHANELRLAWIDRPAGLVDVEFEARLEGWGQLELALKTAAGAQPFSDRVRAKNQWVKAGAVVRLVARENHYQLEVVEPHRPVVGIQIESALAAQLVETCRALSAFLAAVSCDSLSASLSRVEIPMPEPGTLYTIPADLFTVAERAVLDAFTSSLSSAPSSETTSPR